MKIELSENAINVIGFMLENALQAQLPAGKVIAVRDELANGYKEAKEAEEVEEA